MSNATTIRTLWIFAGTVLAKWLGIKRGKPEIEAIFNYVKINDQLSTSGQPTAEQFAAIRDAGFDSVINLLPSGHENSLDEEGDVVAVRVGESVADLTDEGYRLALAQWTVLESGVKGRPIDPLLRHPQ